MKKVSFSRGIVVVAALLAIACAPGRLSTETGEPTNGNPDVELDGGTSVPGPSQDAGPSLLADGGPSGDPGDPPGDPGDPPSDPGDPPSDPSDPPGDPGDPPGDPGDPPGDPGDPPGDPGDPPSDPPSDPPLGAWFDSPRAGADIFVSGHSLIDQVFGWWPLVDGGPIASIASSAGRNHHSVLQKGAGSTAHRRRQDILEGRLDEVGYNRTPRWGDFDTLIVLERSDFVDAMMGERGIEAITWFVDNMIDAAPGGDELFLYQTWWGQDGNPRTGIRSWADWREHVRAELPLVECAAERIGRSRRVRFRVLPAGNAIAALLDEVAAGRAEGLREQDIFASDMVHLSDTGHLYMSLVVFASVYRMPTTGMTVPGLSAAHNALFTRLADRVVGDYYDNYTSPNAGQCRAAMQDMCGRFGNHSCDTDAFFGDSVYGQPVP